MLVITLKQGERATFHEDGKEIGYIQVLTDTPDSRRIGIELPQRISIIRDNAKVRQRDPEKP